MTTSTTIPSTLPVQFIEKMLFAGGEAGFYRLQMGGIIAFEGRLDEERLRRSLRLLLDAEPVLGCSFITDTVPPYWKRLENLDSEELLCVVESDHPGAEASTFIAEDADTAAGPMVRAALYRGSSADVLAVRVGHLAVDGGALKETLYLIGEIYRRLTLQPVWTPEPNLDGVRGPVVKATLLDRLKYGGKIDQMPLPADPEWYVPLLGARGPGKYASATVEPDSFRKAIQLAKSGGATVNDIIVAALYRTMWRLIGSAPGSKTPLMITNELRKHLPPDTKTALCNISSTWSISVSPAADEDFSGTLARVAEATQAWKRGGAGLGSAIGIPLMNRLTRKSGLGLARKMMGSLDDPKSDRSRGMVVLTNIGVIDERLRDFGPSAPIADAWLLAPVAPPGAGFCTSTYRDRLHLAVGFEPAGISEVWVNDLLGGVAQEIEDWVAAEFAE